MTKEELIKHYEKEFELYDYLSDRWDGESDALHEYYDGRSVQIRDILNELNNLNEDSGAKPIEP